MNKTYEVTFADNALPGVLAVGSIRRGQTAKVEAAEALRLVNVKGLAFANADDKRSAEQEVAAAAKAAEVPATADAPTKATPPPLPAVASTASASAAATDTNEEH